MAQRAFVFGYGSLINQGSLLHTLRCEDLGLIVAGRIGGFRRSWSNRSEVRKRTGLGVRKCESAHLNGVAIEVSPSQLQDLDVREAGFGRVIVEDQDLVDGTLWIYTKPEPKPPTAAYPIALSYVDCVLAGCLARGEGFAGEFMQTTAGWDAPILNDRANPQYPRGTPLTARIRERIDFHLAAHLPMTHPARVLKD